MFKPSAQAYWEDEYTAYFRCECGYSVQVRPTGGLKRPTERGIEIAEDDYVSWKCPHCRKSYKLARRSRPRRAEPRFFER